MSDGIQSAGPAKKAARSATRGVAERQQPFGAEVLVGQGVHFRVWAPRHARVVAVLEGGPGSPGEVELSRETDGYFSGFDEKAAANTLYRFRLGDNSTLYPDPASRFQPQGPHGPSQVIEARQFGWTDRDWQGVGRKGQVLYELHVGTFTCTGTWAAAAEELAELARLGITAVEVMPVADFAGRFGWGYDGVCMFAPTRLYGTPDDFRRFVDRAHAAGVGVILDVVYNHLGPDGNYLKQFAADYFTDRYANEWGEALNFDGPNCGPVREFFRSNAAYWIDEFHIDGLRLDATQQIFDASKEHILAEIARCVRAAAAGRATFIAAENETQEVKLVRPFERGGYGIDVLWNDDLHHSAMVAMTGRNEAYYSDYLGTAQELISAVKWGYLYQGQRYAWQKKRRGTPTFDLDPDRFVTFIQNHDQVANSGRGLRCHALTSPGRYRALTALLLLAPGTPMLFMGQEFASSAPFLFFADHKPELAKLVSKGRKEFLQQFQTLASPSAAKLPFPEPADPATFERCKLDFAERQRHADVYALHRDLLALRRSEPVFQTSRPHGFDGAVLEREALVLRFFGADGDDRLLLVNLGRDLHLGVAPEPLLAPPEDRLWEVQWSSEDVRYGGCGTPEPDSDDNWRIPGHAALVLRPKPADKGERGA